MASMSRHFRIDGVDVHDESDCYVIAEIGHNHQGDIEKAKQLMRSAHEWGVNAVKLQKRSNRALYTREFYNQPYDNEFSFGHTYGEHREALELDTDDGVPFRQRRDELREVQVDREHPAVPRVCVDGMALAPRRDISD